VSGQLVERSCRNACLFYRPQVRGLLVAPCRRNGGVVCVSGCIRQVEFCIFWRGYRITLVVSLSNPILSQDWMVRYVEMGSSSISLVSSSDVVFSHCDDSFCVWLDGFCLAECCGDGFMDDEGADKVAENGLALA
jgi:hypothetical protein